MNPNWKKGMKVRSVSDACEDITVGNIYILTRDTDAYGSGGRSFAVEFRDDEGATRRREGVNYELAEEPAAPKGTLERLVIEALPQGGYKLTAPGMSWGANPTDLAGFTTLPEATAFIGRNMR